VFRIAEDWEYNERMGKGRPPWRLRIIWMLREKGRKPERFGLMRG